MASALLAPPPSTDGVTSAQGDASTALGSVTDKIAALGDDQSGPLAKVGGTLKTAGGAIDKVNLDGLTQQFPAALDKMHSAVPPSALEAVGAVAGSYDAANKLLTGGPLSHLQYGAKLQTVALEIINDAVATLEHDIERLAAEIFDPATLALIREGLHDLELFARDFSGNAGHFLKFLSKNLIGLADDVLAELDADLAHAFAVLAPIATDALTALGQLEQAATTALNDLVVALEALEAAGANATAQAWNDVLAKLDALLKAVKDLEAALGKCFDQLTAAIGAVDLSKVMAAYAAALEALDIGHVPTIDDAVDALAGLLDELTGRVAVVIRDNTLPARVDLLVKSIDDTVATAGIRAARDAIHDAFKEIQGAIESIPTEEIQKGIDSMLGAVRDEIKSLDLENVKKSIEAQIDGVATEIGTEVTGLADAVTKEVHDFLAAIDLSPLTKLSDEITHLIGEATQLIKDVSAFADAHVNELKDALAEFDKISFKPLADEVITEIADVKGRLEKIKPEALSAPERLAISAALTVLEAIDLESKVIKVLEDEFDTLRAPLDTAIDVLAVPLEKLAGFFDELDPKKLTGPVGKLLTDVEKEIDRIDPGALLKPARAELDKLIARVGTLDPGALLKPLAGPYDELVKSIGSLNPSEWVKPLGNLFTQLDSLIAQADITPIFDRLDVLRRDLLKNARTKIDAGIAALGLPDPVSGLLVAVTQTLDPIINVAFGDTKALSGQVVGSLDPTTPLKLLDVPFDALLKVITGAPGTALTDAANALRATFGPGLDALDPRTLVAQLHAGQQRLASFDPVALAAPYAGLVPLRTKLDAILRNAPAGLPAQIAQRFDELLHLVDPSLPQGDLTKLAASYRAVTGALGKQLATLDPAVATGPYVRLREDLYRVVPPFLRQHDPLAAPDVAKGLETLRPSVKAKRVGTSLSGFVTATAQIQAPIAAAFDQLLAAVHRALTLVDPVVFKADVAAIYATVRAKVHIVDPAKLADAGKQLFGDVLTQLKAIDPKAIAADLDATYKKLLDTVSKAIKGAFDAIATDLGAKVGEFRKVLKGAVTSFHTAIDGAAAGVGDLVKKIQGLVLIDLVDRFKHFTEKLAKSLHVELERVRKSFDAMLSAIPLTKDSGSASPGI